MSAFNEDFQAPPPPTPESEPPAPRPVKLRPVAIGIFVLGLAVLVAGIVKVVPGGIGTGGVMCFCGILLFILSLVPLPVVRESEEPLSFVEKLTGIFFEPARVF